jgi:UDP-N-acetyl-D-galactosamine dehydrogenase
MNDGMGAWVASQIVKLLIKKGHAVKDSKIIVFGITFKENCPDIRNTKAIDVINELKQFNCDVDVYDPWANADEVKHEYGISLIDDYTKNKYDSIVLAVAHNEFKTLDLGKLRNGHNAVIYDIKGIWDKQEVDGRL